MATKYYDEKANKRSQKYRATHVRQLNVGLSIDYDSDILAHLDTIPNRAGYIKALIRADIAARANSDQTKEETTMKRISIDNGHSFVEPEEAIQLTPVEPGDAPTGLPWDVIVNMMDDDTFQQVRAELAPCGEIEFLRRYLELAPDDLIIG